MRIKLSMIWATILLIAPCSCSPSLETLATLPLWIENVVVRANNKLLLTTLGTATIYTFDPSFPSQNATHLVTIPDANGLVGIAEISPDVFITAAGTWNFSTGDIISSASIWRVDLRKNAPEARLVVTVPESNLLNGVAALPGCNNAVLVSDTFAGIVYKINVKERNYEPVIQDPLFAPPDAVPSLGVNGIRIHGGYLYFVNSDQGLFGRVPISRTGHATGNTEVLFRINATETTYMDDFAIDGLGNVYIATHPNILYVLDRYGKVKTVLDRTELNEPTSAVFGRGRAKDRLYVTTGSGKLVAIDRRELS
ncbi:hypothetical protein CC78DRAFT_6319 [Lojkania enalia]|uniref:SMP-30/Gluconolactonase/LRE-like region domain-containing protein n=1 Tax=Lojkania enalia TaxID=147567 RepID=A0A9P4ND47_9PLEO|nr:hypothetical protein CC78DRAFT_6319 [Didymosphaeria enalia]